MEKNQQRWRGHVNKTNRRADSERSKESGNIKIRKGELNRGEKGERK